MKEIHLESGATTVEGTVDVPKIRLLSGGQSEVEEGERTFTAEEVYVCVEHFDGINRKDFTAVIHVKNSAGVLVAIHFYLKNEEAIKKFGFRTGYSFQLRLKPQPNTESFGTTIQRFYEDDDGMVINAKEVARFVDGSWK